MNISDLEFHAVEIGRTDSAVPIRTTLVRLATDSGLEGWGESPLGWRSDELPGRRDALLPMLSGRSIFEIEELHTLQGLSDPALRCALEMACWDMVGRVAGQPLSRLFGGGYRLHVPLAACLSGQRPDHVAQLSRELAEQGLHCQMIVASGDPSKDVAMVSAVSDASSERVELRFDGAEQYDMETARELCAELEPFGLQYVLDPLDACDLQEVAALARQTAVPLAVGRAILGPADVLAAVKSQAIDCVVIDPTRVGGISPARQCAAVAAAGRIHAVLGSGDSLGVATAAMLQLVAATPAFSTFNDSAYHELRGGVLVEPLEIADGMLAVPQGPGLGIEVDRAKLDRHQAL